MKPYYEVSTNNDESCFCCCHGEGVTIYDSYPLQKRLNLIFNDKDDVASDNEGTGIGKCSLLNRSNYIALVGGAQNGIKPAFPVNQVVIWDDLLKKVIFKLKFIYPVERVFLTRLYILVLVFNEIQLFTFTNPRRNSLTSNPLTVLKTRIIVPLMEHVATYLPLGLTFMN